MKKRKKKVIFFIHITLHLDTRLMSSVDAMATVQGFPCSRSHFNRSRWDAVHQDPLKKQMKKSLNSAFPKLPVITP